MTMIADICYNITPLEITHYVSLALERAWQILLKEGLTHQSARGKPGHHPPLVATS